MADKLTYRLERMLARAVEVRAESAGKTQDVAAGFVDGLHAALSAIRELAEPTPNGHRYVCIAGSPVTGFSYHGPFTSWRDAEAWGERHAPKSEFWIAPLAIEAPPLGPRLAVNNPPTGEE